MRHWVKGLLKHSLILVAVLLVGVNTVACGRLTATASPTITPQSLLQKINTNTAPLILDVRTVEEFEAGHVPGAVNIPIQDLKERLDELKALPQSESVVVYCERGIRANRAEIILNEANLGAVLHLEGDMQQWRQGDFPVQFPQ